MGCGCKQENQNLRLDLGKNKGINLEVGASNKIIKFFLFVISIPILFLSLPYIIYILFNSIVLEKNSFSIINMMSKLGSKIKGINKKNDDYDDDDDDDDVIIEELDPNDFELINVDIIDTVEK